MTLNRFSITLTSLGLLLGSNLGLAATPSAANSAEVAERTPGAVKREVPAKADISKTKAKAKIKLVDINSANKAALLKLPGITAANVDKIIAGRPYGSKAWLLTNNVIDANTFYAIKPLIEAKQPYKSVEENIAFYEKLKKEKKAKP
jgi:DNA uptake protein ComE-like DNA-binding protein